MMGELWNSCICMGSGGSCKTIVEDQLDGTSESSSSESRMDINIDEDDGPSSQSSILIGFLRSMEALFFSISTSVS